MSSMSRLLVQWTVRKLVWRRRESPRLLANWISSFEASFRSTLEIRARSGRALVVCGATPVLPGCFFTLSHMIWVAIPAHLAE